MNKKFVIGIIVFILLIFGLAIVFAGKGSSKAVVEKTVGAKIKIDHLSKEMGDISYDNGLISHSFPVKNVGTKNLEIANMATSCMCTNVYIKTNEGKSEQFGMKGMSNPSDWKGIIEPGKTAEVIAVFDPQYHGPQGVGPVSRTVSMETNDPDHPYVEFSFEGNVIK
jgi:hypothetical protein